MFVVHRLLFMLWSSTFFTPNQSIFYNLLMNTMGLAKSDNFLLSFYRLFIFSNLWFQFLMAVLNVLNGFVNGLGRLKLKSTSREHILFPINEHVSVLLSRTRGLVTLGNKSNGCCSLQTVITELLVGRSLLLPKAASFSMQNATLKARTVITDFFTLNVTVCWIPLHISFTSGSD